VFESICVWRLCGFIAIGSRCSASMNLVCWLVVHGAWCGLTLLALWAVNEAYWLGVAQWHTKAVGVVWFGASDLLFGWNW
jgi:hypothetical protein